MRDPGPTRRRGESSGAAPSASPGSSLAPVHARGGGCRGALVAASPRAAGPLGRIASDGAESDEIQAEFAAAQERWRRAIHAHRMAPPDAGFSERLAELADAARTEAAICRRAEAAGFQWPPHKSTGRQPYELQPGTGRRGPEALWRRFDAAVARAQPRRRRNRPDRSRASARGARRGSGRARRRGRASRPRERPAPAAAPPAPHRLNPTRRTRARRARRREVCCVPRRRWGRTTRGVSGPQRSSPDTRR